MAAGTTTSGWWPRRYRLAWLRPDLIAGLSTAAVVIPQSMAYAALAGLPVEVGLYSASVPMAAYALAGTSRPLSVSVSSSIAAVTAVAVAGAPDPAQAASTLALFSGLFLAAAWIFKLGFVADLISAPVLAGFKVGIGISIAAGQLDSLLGVPIASDRVLGQIWSAVQAIPNVSLPTVIMSVACIAVLLAGKRWLKQVPAPLIVVVGAIIASRVWHLSAYGIELIGTVPSGIPVPTLPNLAGSQHLIGPALGVAVITFVESIAAARAFRQTTDRPVIADRELGALGIANVVAALVRGMPAGGGMSQTAVNDGAGAKSPLAAVTTALTVVITLLFLAPLFSDLPQAALGALVFVAAVGLVDIKTQRQIFAVYRRDGVLAVIAAVAVIAGGALNGILAAVLISSLTLLYEASRRPIEIVDTVPAEEESHRAIPPDMLVLRPGSDIHFANVQHVRRDFEAAITDAEVKPAVVLIDGSRLSIFEFTAHQALRDMVADFNEQGIEVWAILPSGSAQRANARFAQIFGTGDVTTFPTIGAAVTYFIGSRPTFESPSESGEGTGFG